MRRTYPVFQLFFCLPFLVFAGLHCGGGGSSSGSSSSTAGGGSVASSPSAMSSGDIVNVSFSGGSGSVSFSGTSGTYELLVMSQATGSSTNTYTVSGDSNFNVGADLDISDPMEDAGIVAVPAESVQTAFEAVLRDEEVYLENEPWNWEAPEVYEQQFAASVGVGKAGGGGGASPEFAVSVNDTDTFRVLDSLTDTTQYVEVTATAKCVNDKVAVFVDNEVLTTNPADFPQSDINTVCSLYQTHTTQLQSWLGTYSDINSDGVVVALVTSQINKLSGGSGIVTGYFYSGDFFARSGSIPASNAREIVYLRAPDSAGLYGTAVTNSFMMSNFLPPVYAHELQHLISYYQHTIARSGSSEATWLNEGLSHLIEDLVGENVENPSRYDLYLASPQSYSLVSSTASLAQRGASYLFLRYLYEQSDNSTTFLTNLVQTTNTGVANVEAAFPNAPSDLNTFEEFMLNWAAALGYTDRGISSSSRYNYDSRGTHATSGNPTGVCLICAANDNRGTVLSGPTYSTYSGSTSYSIRDSAIRFLKLSSTPSSVSISAGASSSPAAIVLRTK